MRDELDKALCEKYPKIFVNRHGDPRETLMCWGFEIGDGWYDIIDLACGEMQNHIDWRNGQHERAVKFNAMLAKAIAGDHTELDEYVNSTYIEEARKQYKEKILKIGLRPVPEAVNQVIAVQIKEKFGTLRFYFDGGDEFCRGVEAMATSMSARTCEVCGKPGKKRGASWLYTACDDHTKESDREDV